MIIKIVFYIQIRLIVKILLSSTIALHTVNVSYASSTESNSSTDTTVDSILGALADMTADEAKKVVSLRFSREFRDKVCGLYRYGTTLDPNRKENKLRILFDNTCKYVSRKVERNILSKELLEIFKKDMVTNGVLLAKYDKVDNSEKFNKLVEARENMAEKVDDLNNTLFAINVIYLSWKDKSPKEIIFQALSESEIYEPYLKVISNMAATAEEINKLEGVIKNSLKITKINAKSVEASYYALSKKTGDLKPYNITLKLDMSGHNVRKIKPEMASLFLSMANSSDKASLKDHSRSLLKVLLNSNCTMECAKSINRLIDNQTDDIFVTLSSILEMKKESEEKNDIEWKRFRQDKALRTLSTLSEFSNVSSKESARAILEKYQTDENTRTVRYWESSWSFGTLLGAAGGKAECSACEDRVLPLSLYAPFGLFFTKGWTGVQLHVFDLGQYINDTDNNQDDQTTTWEDAVAPGIAIFLRKRSFPLSVGFDYTYKADNDERNYSEHQYRIFIAMDLELFSLN